jgi:hypothetical protein
MVNDNKLFAIVLSPNTGKTMRVVEVGKYALEEALDLHRTWPHCDVYLCSSPPRIATPDEMDEAWCYWPELDHEPRRWGRSW